LPLVPLAVSERADAHPTNPRPLGENNQLCLAGGTAGRVLPRHLVAGRNRATTSPRQKRDA